MEDKFEEYTVIDLNSDDYTVSIEVDIKYDDADYNVEYDADEAVPIQINYAIMDEDGELVMSGNFDINGDKDYEFDENENLSIDDMEEIFKESTLSELTIDDLEEFGIIDRDDIATEFTQRQQDMMVEHNMSVDKEGEELEFKGYSNLTPASIQVNSREDGAVDVLVNNTHVQTFESGTTIDTDTLDIPGIDINEVCQSKMEINNEEEYEIPSASQIREKEQVRERTLEVTRERS